MSRLGLRDYRLVAKGVGVPPSSAASNSTVNNEVIVTTKFEVNGLQVEMKKLLTTPVAIRLSVSLEC